ncbi:unnamed protein product [Tilletia controversa]|uniref:RRM domain-containing protein n=1 Tax=Tilletia controversa TaxID=13291 RepID=A0A8X7SZV1_9BASI|nr:hypothetical protein CF328_g2677 [Tilletia controversa]KAE8253881.1 hypothetical protein A4X06_0g1178 [Tilletia controversa]CAD6921563.1 unnamed protein product [Tilletia controversa]CAD6967531.1 unnamed protein product [Tilletia controversa]
MASSSATTHLTRRIAAGAGTTARGVHRSFASSSRSADSEPRRAPPRILPPLLSPSTSRLSGSGSGSGSGGGGLAEKSSLLASPPPPTTASRYVLISNLPINSRPSDIYRLTDPSSLHRLRDLHSLTFLRTPTLNPTGEAIADFITDTSARRFQRGIDGSRLSGLHVRATQLAPQKAKQMLTSHLSANLSIQLIHLLLISQTSGFTVLLRGLPPSLYVSRLHEVLHKGYSLAPPTNIRQSRKTIHLRSLFDTSSIITQRTKAVLSKRNDELYRVLVRKRKIGVNALRASLEEEAQERAGNIANNNSNNHHRESDEADNAALQHEEQEPSDTDNDLESYRPAYSSPFGPSQIDGIEGPDLRLDYPHEDAENPYAYTSFGKAYWDVIWQAAKTGYSIQRLKDLQQPHAQEQMQGMTLGDHDDDDDGDHSSSSLASAPGFVPFLPVTKLPYPSARGDHNQTRAWFLVRMTDAADAHRLVRRWHNMYYAESIFGQRYHVEAQVLH